MTFQPKNGSSATEDTEGIIGYSTPMQPTGPSHTKEISLFFLVGALLTGHIMASMALLVLPAVAPVVAREYAIDASLIGYFITLVCVGQLVTLTLFGKPAVAVVMLQLRAPCGFAVLGALISSRLKRLKNSARTSSDFFSPSGNRRPILIDSMGRRCPRKSL